MEGYFTIEHYCDLAGIKKNTAYVRAYRGNIKAFNEDGKWFFYYNDETEDIPDGFIRYDEYAESVGLNRATIYAAIKRHVFDNDDVTHLCDRICNGKRKKHYYIRKKTPYPTRKDIIIKYNNLIKEKINALRPKGYLTVPELAKREDCQEQTIYKRLWRNAIPNVVKVNKYWYIPEDIHVSVRRYKKEA